MTTAEALRYIRELVNNADKLPEHQRRIVLEGVATLVRKARIELEQNGPVVARPPMM
ncbi:hypothetical protein V5279_41005 [Bradyrhizobium sp. 26S5]|uniref:hypothetical protein n=1 Tax=Bradyrhizobium sp. 26S5 TaxID=3139729 RepID=UPI0030CD7A99